MNSSLRNPYTNARCVIYFYLEDDSIHVAEPKQQNSGIPQGVFLKRHRIPKNPSVADGQTVYYTKNDLNVGKDVVFYERHFHICSCDPFTRKFLESKGIEVPEDKPFPREPIAEFRDSLKKIKSGGPPKPSRDDLTRFVEAQLGKASNALLEDKLKQFVAHDRQVLRFYCLWDDRGALFGDKLPYTVHYYLADDTVEILEVNEPNSGRDPFPVFLKRAKLPNQAVEIDALGPTRKWSYYKWTDFQIGACITVYGRTFLIHDADEFTKNFYVKNKIPMGETIDVEEEPVPLPQMEVPPYNGFGSREDSLQNCTNLITKPAKKDFQKLMHNEKKILRYSARLVEGDRFVLTQADKERKFILQYFLADDTVSIFEPPARNSGIISGKFLERTRLDMPGTTKAYTPGQFFVGSVISVHNRLFELVEADEFSLKYMESNPHEFPMSDYRTVVSELNKFADKEEGLRSAFIAIDEDGSGQLTLDELAAACESAGIVLVRQQVITMMRNLDTSQDGKVSIEEFLRAFGVAIDKE